MEVKNVNKYIKTLDNPDTCGWDFAKEMLAGDPTSAVDFDRFQYEANNDHFYIIEFLRCKETQPFVTPHSSHPKYYWAKDSRKFISLYRAASRLNGTLYLVNYAVKGTSHDNQIRVIRVDELNNNGITKEYIWNTDRDSFQIWFRALNSICLTPKTLDIDIKPIIHSICVSLNNGASILNILKSLKVVYEQEYPEFPKYYDFFYKAVISLQEVAPLTHIKETDLTDEFVYYYLKFFIDSQCKPGDNSYIFLCNMNRLFINNDKSFVNF